VFCRSLLVFSGVRVALSLVFWVGNDLQNTTQENKDRATRTPLKTNNDLQNTTQETKDRATRTPLNTNNDIQNTTQKTKDRATRTPLHCLSLVEFVLLYLYFPV
jgi:hypothetical protein